MIMKGGVADRHREHERRRLRRDLHDGLGPLLASIAMQVEAAAGLATSDPEAARALLVRLGGQMNAAIAELRGLAQARRPPMLEEHGLTGALRAHAACLAGGELEVSIDVADNLPPLPQPVEDAAYRIALEALTNAMRHAGATRCMVTVAGHRCLEITVIDDGAGLPPTIRPGVGLASMRARAAELGGRCTVGSAPGGGTAVRARLPLPPGLAPGHPATR